MSHRIGCVGYATEQGLGHLMKWFYDEGVVTDPLLVLHPRHPHHPEWYPDRPVVNPAAIPGELAEGWDAALFFETPFDWAFPDKCRAAGIRTVMVPMHEWFPETPRHTFSTIVAPSLLDKDYFAGSVFLPIPAPPVRWYRREKANRFLHNAGHVGHREHKGTRTLLEALKFSKAGYSLTVRCQYNGMLRQMVESAGAGNDPRLVIEDGYLPYDKLFDGFDAYVAPEKLNGLSLPLLEAFCSGMLVVTTDRYPQNTWLPNDALIPVTEYVKSRVSASCLQVDEAVVKPETVAAVLDFWAGREIACHSGEGLDYARSNSWDVLRPKWLDVILNGV